MLLNKKLIKKQLYQKLNKIGARKIAVVGSYGKTSTKNFLDTLNDLRKQSKLLSTVGFINYLIDKINFNEYVMSLSLPNQAIANVRLFTKRAEEFGSTDFKGIFNFIHFISII